MAVGGAMVSAPVLAWADEAFWQRQTGYQRVQTALKYNLKSLKTMLGEQGVPFPPAAVFLRVFKREQALEFWARGGGAARYQLIRTYPICAASGVPGPKRREGDLQVPEGFYLIADFNPWSRFELSMHLNYPNRSDRVRGVQGRLGGDIFIHGSCASIGCLAMTDGVIRDLYLACLAAWANGQRGIPVHIFPDRLHAAGLAALRAESAGRPALVAFWEALKPGYEYFEAHRHLPAVQVAPDGRYVVTPP